MGGVGLVGEVGGRITSLYLLSPHQTQPWAAGEDTAAGGLYGREKRWSPLLEHQLLEVEVRDLSQQSPGFGGLAAGVPSQMLLSCLPPRRRCVSLGGQGCTNPG